MLINNFFGHLKTVLIHKWYVFKLSLRVGIPWQGIIHDMSKFSYIEFSESVKYYQGNRSPIAKCKDENGYSKAWLHHKGRNKHHYQYWYDYEAIDSTPIIPYKYLVELICDSFAAGMAYNGKGWKNDTQLLYWNKTKSLGKINPRVKNMLEEVYVQVSQKGIKDVLTKSNLKRLYAKHCEEGDMNSNKTI